MGLSNSFLFKLILVASLASVGLTGCSDGPSIRETAELSTLTENFLRLCGTTGPNNIKSLYEPITQYPNFCNPIESEVIKVGSKEGKFLVHVRANCRYEGERDIRLLYAKEGNENYQLTDTYGLVNSFDEQELDFARFTGCLAESDSSDLAKVEALKRADKLFSDLETTYVDSLKAFIDIQKWGWKPHGTRQGGRVKGKLMNNTNLDIPVFKLAISFLDKDEKLITMHRENLYKLAVGKSYDFDFNVPFIGKATDAKLDMEFRPEFLKSFLMERLKENAPACQ